MIKVAICESNFIQNDFLKNNINEFLTLKKVKHEIFQYSSCEYLLKKYHKNFDLIILKINPFELNSLDNLRQIRKLDTSVEVIFITSSLNYISNILEVSPYGYLLEPILIESLEKILNQFIIDKSRKIKNISIKSNKRNHIIKVDDILYLEVYKKETTIHTQAQTFVTNMRLKNLEEHLKHNNFFRCHNSFLVNLDKISSYTNNEIEINKSYIPVSRRSSKELSKILNSELLMLV